MGISQCILFWILALFSFWLFYRKTHDCLNPVGIMSSSWFFVAGLCQLKLGEYQTDWHEGTYLAVMLAGVTLVTVGVLFLDEKRARFRLDNARKGLETAILVKGTLHNAIMLWSLICILSIIVITIKYNYNWFYVFTNSLSGNKGEWVKPSPYILDMISSTVPHVAVFVFFDLINKKKQSNLEKIYKIFYICTSFYFILFVMVSRGTAVIALLGILYVINRKSPFSLSKIAVILCSVLILFGIFATFRWRTDDFSSKYIFSGKSSSKTINAVIHYMVYQFQNLDKLIDGNYVHTYYTAVFKSILKAIGEPVENSKYYISSAGNNASTFIFSYYQDLGYIGIIVFTSFDAWLITKFYNMSNRREEYSLILAAFQKGVFTTFFDDYILTLNTMLLPVILIMMIARISGARMHYSLYSLEENHSFRMRLGEDIR